MSAPNKANTFRLVKVQTEERLATASDPTLTPSLTTGSCKAKGTQYEATAEQRYGLRFVPSLNLAALKARPRKEKQLLLWYCLRAIDTTGCGVLDQEMTINILTASFHYKWRTAYKHLRAGDGVFWQRRVSRQGRSVIILSSLVRVACRLGVSIKRSDRFIELPSSELPPSGQMQARRAILYNSGAYKPSTSHCNHPISRRSLTEKTGIEERQQRRYDRIMEARGPVREPTFAYYCERNTRKLKPFVRLVETARGKVLTHELPNRYQTPYVAGSIGMLSKAAKVIRATKESCDKGEATFNTSHRRYYRNVKSFTRAALKGKATEGYYPSRSSNRKYILETI